MQKRLVEDSLLLSEKARTRTHTHSPVLWALARGKKVSLTLNKAESLETGSLPSVLLCQIFKFFWFWFS